MDKDKKIHKLNDEIIKEVSGGQTIGEWQAQHRIQPAPGVQTLVKQGQSGSVSGQAQECWEWLWCPKCQKSFRANIMLDLVFCDQGHAIEIKG